MKRSEGVFANTRVRRRREHTTSPLKLHENELREAEEKTRQIEGQPRLKQVAKGNYLKYFEKITRKFEICDRSVTFGK